MWYHTLTFIHVQIHIHTHIFGKESTCNVGDPSSIPGSGRSSGEGTGYPLQYSWTSLVAQSISQSVQSFSRVWLFMTTWTAACQASLSIANSGSLLKLMSIESVMPSNHLILCHPLLLPPSIFSSIRHFSNESVLRIRWPQYWSLSFSISLSKEYSGLISI